MRKVIFRRGEDPGVIGSSKNNMHAVSDSTDHLAFICGVCGKMVEIVRIEIDRKYHETTGAAIFFTTKCAICGEVAWRKTYTKVLLDDTGRNALASMEARYAKVKGIWEEMF